MKVEDFVKTAGRKFFFGYASLGAITALCGVGVLSGDRFEMCFGALIGALMAANYGEHREKQRAAKEAAAEAPKETP